MTAIVDYPGLGFNVTVSQFQQMPIFQGFLAAFGQECQEIEFAFQQLMYKRLLQYAEGVQLDELGDALDCARPSGMGDQDYFNLLNITILRNTCAGDVDSIINYVMALTQSTSVLYATGSNLQTFWTTNGNYVANLPQLILDVMTVGCGIVNVHQPPDPPGFWETA